MKPKIFSSRWKKNRRPTWVAERYDTFDGEARASNEYEALFMEFIANPRREVARSASVAERVREAIQKVRKYVEVRISPTAMLLFKHLRVNQIFGANTDVGKTILTTALVRASALTGKSVFYLKPVSTGPPQSADDKSSPFILTNHCRYLIVMFFQTCHEPCRTEEISR